MDDLTDFEREGFFKVDSLHVPEHVEENFGPFLDVFYRLNKLAWSLQYEMSIPKPENDIRRAWCAILYARTLNFVQASVMLATKGMRVQADTQHRCALETLFKLGALTNDEQFIVDYDLAETMDTIRQINAHIEFLKRKPLKPIALIKMYTTRVARLRASLISAVSERRPAHLKPNKNFIRIDKSLENHPELKEKIYRDLKVLRPDLFKEPQERALSKLSIPSSKYAKKADRLNMYDLHYRMGSAAVHSDAKSLEDGHFELNEDGTVREFKNEPHLEDLDMVIHTLCEAVIDAVRFVGQALEYDVPEDELRSIEKALEACHKDEDSVPN